MSFQIFHAGIALETTTETLTKEYFQSLYNQYADEETEFEEWVSELEIAPFVN